MTISKWLVVLGMGAALGCGTIEGDVYGADSTESTRVPDVEVLLVKQSDSLIEVVKKFCQDERSSEVQRDEERKRLERRAAELKDSAAVVFGLEYQSARWRRLMDASAAAADSGNRISVANADPVALAEQGALKRARTDSNGHYRLPRVRFGSYFVVPLVRESEFAAVQWYPTRLWFGTKRVNANGRDGWAGCYLPAMDSLEAGRN